MRFECCIHKLDRKLFVYGYTAQTNSLRYKWNPFTELTLIIFTKRVFVKRT